ncbi:MAG TPA: small ribosomal subunit Rsm22 family protein, partial [Sandaracinaceae bacterium LLY-WYZ-13_1]|nr:small ribosomal subunit Rsm22 family protein [Sandaracinaceae bacterium LLY-WYZ-13_1]
WRVLDAGAGLGATTLGAAELAGRVGVERLEVTALERDAASLDVFTQVARQAAEDGLVPPIALDARRADLDGLDVSRLPEADLVLVGLTLNELFTDRDEADRRDAREAFVRDLAGRLRPGGALVLLEPALRGPTRELQRLRDRLVEDGGAPYLFAPCLRDGPCPLLRRARDWCHDVLPFELPEALADLAASAGLRGERLTYASLTLRAERRRLWDVADRDPHAFRIVGGPIGSKGKTEWDGCGAPGLVRLRLLDRERSEANRAMEGAIRGTLVRLDREPADGAQLRLRPDVPVERIG